MSSTSSRSLAGFALVHLAVFAAFCAWQLAMANGLVLADGTSPVGGDFVNLWTAGRMVIEGQAADIYDPARFMALQQERVGADIGFRLWAYPPHSIVLAVPFGALGYFAALAAWSALGLAALAYGARRIGFDRNTTLILLLSPASLLCVYWGQTGNLACGLLMVALSQRGVRDGAAIGATALLSIKPQLGLLVPVLWLLSRQWKIIAFVCASIATILAITLALGGRELWEAYLFQTLPQLSAFERYGTGPFMNMIPSMFMALRIVTGDGDLAANLHMVLAVGLVALCIWLIAREGDLKTRQAVVLLGTAAITPYLHVYDLTIVLGGAFLLAQRFEASEPSASFWSERAVTAAFALPYLTLGFNSIGAPIAPLVLLALLVPFVWKAALRTAPQS